MSLPLTVTFVGYGFPSAAELPSYERVEMVTPTPNNPLQRTGSRCSLRPPSGAFGRQERRACLLRA